MSILHSSNPDRVQGYCTHCGQDLADVNAGQSAGSTVDCPFCHSTLYPEEIKEERTHEQGLLWDLVDSLRQAVGEANEAAREATARLEEARRQNDALLIQLRHCQDSLDEVQHG